MADEWYYARNKERFGPHSAAELRKLAVAGQLKADDLVWNENMSEWKPASAIPGLCGPAQRDDVPRPTSDAAAKVAQAGRGFMSKIADFADKAGNFAGEAVVYDQTLPADANKPAIFLQELYFGGRGNIGSSLAMLKTGGGIVMAILFSFAYIGLILYFSLSSWQFLPYSKTELVRITLRQKLRWEKLLPIVIGWVITLLIGIIIAVSWTWFMSKIHNLINPAADSFLQNALQFLASLSIVIFLVFYFFANWIACLKSANLTAYTRSCILLDYGFPNKTRLLVGVSDAPLEKQIDGVLALCDAIAKANFAPWEQLSANRNFGLRTYLAALMRRITG